MTTADLIVSIRRQADIAVSTDRGAVLAEAADRLEALAEDGERLDFFERQHAEIVTRVERHIVCFYCSMPRDVWHLAPTAREAIDAARGKEKGGGP